MFTVSPVSILYGDFKKKILYLKCISSFYNQPSNGSFHHSLWWELKKKKIQNTKSLTPYLLFLVIVGIQVSLLI